MENLKLADSLQIDKTYFFLDSIDLIEGSKLKRDFLKEEKMVFLGKFIGFIGFVWNHDWIDQAKAQFDNGVISCGHYHKIVEECK
jgi:hypothetical protein